MFCNMNFRSRLAARLLIAVWSLSLVVLSVPTEVVAQAEESPPAEIDPAVAADLPDAEADSTAKKSSSIPTNLFEMMTVGKVSWFMLPIVVASVISFWFAIERLLILRRSTVIPYAFVTRFLEHLDQDRLDQHLAVKLCDENSSPVAHVFAHGVRKWGKPSVEIEQAIIDGGERQVSYLRKHLRVLNGVATVAPLLGLLGTVVGMIMAFNEMAEGVAIDKSVQLAGGIGVALLTTAGGLTVAIPSLILYMYLSGRVDLLVMEMDALAQKVVSMISAEALTERKTRGRATPKPKGKITAESA